MEVLFSGVDSDCVGMNVGWFLVKLFFMTVSKQENLGLSWNSCDDNSNPVSIHLHENIIV